MRSSALQGESVWAKSGRNRGRSSGQVWFLRYINSLGYNFLAKLRTESAHGFEPNLVSEKQSLGWDYGPSMGTSQPMSLSQV